MPNCCILGCSHRTGKQESCDVRYYHFPSTRARYGNKLNEQLFKRRLAWLKNSNQRATHSLSQPVVCSAHFHSGSPCKDDYDEANPDWAPTIFPKNVGSTEPSRQDVNRHERRIKRESLKDVSSSYDQDGSSSFDQDVSSRFDQELSMQWDDTNNESTSITSINTGEDQYAELSKEFEELKIENQLLKQAREKYKQELDCAIQLIDDLAEKNSSISGQLDELRANMQSSVKNSTILSQVESSEDMMRYYTGLNSLELFNGTFDALLPALKNDSRFKIELKEQYLITLMKLRLNLSNKDIGFRFGISPSTVCRYIEKFVNVMFVRLPPVLLRWPDEEASQFTMPLSFKTNYPRCTCVIDCFETNCEMHGYLLAKLSLYSKYKGHHTGKFLIVITPQGHICFISKGYGGRVTDVEIVRDSGLLDLLKENNEVMADRGFLIADDLEKIGASLVMPAFKGTRSQLEGSETEMSRLVANVRIHVERVIGDLRKRFTILRGPIKIRDMCTDPHDETYIDKIVTVCCCLHNAMPSVVPPY